MISAWIGPSAAAATTTGMKSASSGPPLPPASSTTPVTSKSASARRSNDGHPKATTRAVARPGSPSTACAPTKPRRHAEGDHRRWSARDQEHHRRDGDQCGRVEEIRIPEKETRGSAQAPFRCRGVARASHRWAPGSRKARGGRGADRIARTVTNRPPPHPSPESTAAERRAPPRPSIAPCSQGRVRAVCRSESACARSMRAGLVARERQAARCRGLRGGLGMGPLLGRRS